MSSDKIKILIDRFTKAYDDCGHARIMMDKGDLSKIEKEEWEFQYDYNEDQLHYIAKQIQELKPSKYMMEKYEELSDILTYV